MEIGKFQRWCFTFFYKNGADKKHIQDLEQDRRFTYLCYGKEVCPETGRKHLQGWFYLKDPYQRKTVKKMMGVKCYLEACNGSVAQNEIYCGKDDKVFSFGKIPKQGTRNDLTEIRTRILDGESIRDLLYEGKLNNNQQLKFAEGCKKYRRPPKREMPKIYWYYGATGTGKTQTAARKAGDDVYWVEPNGEWWDGYCNEESVIWDEFRGQIPLNKWLRLCDRHPYMGAQKGTFEYIQPKKIFFTSPFPPEQVYKNCGEQIDQLYRRITESGGKIKEMRHKKNFSSQNEEEGRKTRSRHSKKNSEI